MRRRAWIAGLLASGLPAWTGAAEIAPDPAAALDRAMAVAEASLRKGDARAAEGQYRTALQEGWLLVGALEGAAGRLEQSREAFRKATAAAAESPQALRGLAAAHLRMRETAPAVEILTRLASKDPKDVQSRRLLAQALAAEGRTAEAVQRLEEARAAAPEDLALAYDLAAGYLRVKRGADADALFAQIRAARPMARTHVLIARACHDAGDRERARVELRAALKLDPGVRWAHYYLGMIAVEEAGVAEIDAVTREFRAELKLAPEDPAANVQLGMALVEARRPAEALPPLETAARAPRPEARTFYFLGRCLLGLDRPAEALAALRRALELAEAEQAGDGQLGSVHNQLGVVLRTVGAQEESAAHFAEAERLLAKGAETAREQMTRYLADAPDPAAGPSAAPPVDPSPLAQLPPPQREDLQRRATAALARAYLNLGVMQAQAERFAAAADLFEEAAALDPDFPQVQFSLGIARFNAKQLDKAVAPLARALAASPGNAGLRRMLAMASLETKAYERAAELLRDDPERDKDPSLQYAYGLALSHSGRTAEAEAIFASLLAQHGDWAELHVMLGKAHAQEGDFPKAIESLTRALQLKADVPEANGTLGVIYLKQGLLPEAEKALRAELKTSPGDLECRKNLAVVLESEQQTDEALGLLRGILETRPDLPDAQYLVGKILLAQGTVAEAVEHLEAAARLAPEDANVRYQLGRAYTQQGRTDLAEREFEAFRQIKAKR
jgi:tetratricopeptide (TPR) repeat protein